MMFLILFEYEHVKSVIFHIFPHAFPPMTYSCSQLEVNYSPREPSHKQPPPLTAISQYINLAGFIESRSMSGHWNGYSLSHKYPS